MSGVWWRGKILSFWRGRGKRAVMLK